MCAPFAGSDAAVKVTDASPYPPSCSSQPARSTPGPSRAICGNQPTRPQPLIGVWQQDRWSNGGARGLGTGVSFDGGKT